LKTKDELVANAASLEFDLDKLAREGMLAIDHVHVDPNEIAETGDYDLEGLFIRLKYAIESIGAKRVVLDTIESLVVSGPSGEKVFTLEGAEHPYRVLVESMNEGAVSLSSDGTILYCNSAFARMARVPLDQIMGRDMWEFVPDEQRDTLKRLIREARHEAVRAEMTIAGANLPTQFSLNPVNLEEGPSIGVIVTDLSERKRNEQAEAALRMRDEFLAIASHELRTPLSTLILRLELLEHHAAKGDLAQVQTSVRRAQDQTERIGRLVDRLLDVSQLASGRLKLNLAPCDLGDVVKEVAERLLEHASNAGSELRLTLSSGIGARSDRFRLEEAISNVISNAIKYGAGHPVDV
jgi:PAS domain S-box-containing protein